MPLPHTPPHRTEKAANGKYSLLHTCVSKSTWTWRSANDVCLKCQKAWAVGKFLLTHIIPKYSIQFTCWAPKYARLCEWCWGHVINKAGKQKKKNPVKWYVLQLKKYSMQGQSMWHVHYCFGRKERMLQKERGFWIRKGFSKKRQGPESSREQFMVESLIFLKGRCDVG